MAWVAAGLLLGLAASTAVASPTSPYTPVAGPWRPVVVPAPTPAPTAAPESSYAGVMPPPQPMPTSRPTVRPTRKPTPPVVGHAKTPATPRLSGRSVTGVASYYAYVPGGAAAGPALRAAIGSAWRGSRVTVCAGSQCVTAVLSDWCACYGTRVIDLDTRLFAALAPLSRGLVAVTVRY